METLKELVGPVLLFWIVLIGFAIMVGGQKAATKVVKGPFKFVGQLILDGVAAIASFLADAAGGIIRWVARGIESGIRRLFRMPPRRRPPRQPPQGGQNP